MGTSAQSGAKRISLPLTRKIIHKILDGSIEQSEFETDGYFGFQIPIGLKDIEPKLLNPIRAWSNVDEFESSARSLVKKFQENYKQYDLGDKAIREAGPAVN